VGWYHTGPRLRESDLDVQELMTNYCAHPILVVCEVEVCTFNFLSYLQAQAFPKLMFLCFNRQRLLTFFQGDITLSNHLCYICYDTASPDDCVLVVLSHDKATIIQMMMDQGTLKLVWTQEACVCLLYCHVVYSACLCELGQHVNKCNKGEIRLRCCWWLQPKDMGLPTTAYYAKDQIREVSYSFIRNAV
jgi:hypothetical protein